MAAPGGRGSYSGNSPSPCGGGGKSGAFAILRLTYYSFGNGFSERNLGTVCGDGYCDVYYCIWMQPGGERNPFEEKAGLFYHKQSVLYPVRGSDYDASWYGGAMTHMVFHAFMKICSFFCAGAIMHQTEKHYVHELDGLGRRMPWVFGIFTVSALALMGVPGLAGFISKWNLARAAVGERE